MVAQEQVGQILKASYIVTEIIDKISISRFIGFNILMVVVSSLTLFGASTFFRQKSFSI